MGKIVFEYINGKKEEYNSLSVTPYSRLGESRNPDRETIANALQEKRSFIILPEKEGELEKIINPHMIKCISKDY